MHFPINRSWTFPSKVLSYVVLIFVIVTLLFPIYWMFSTSLKIDADIAIFPPELIPKVPTFSNYVRVITLYPMEQYILNSIIVCCASVAICLAVGSITGYGLSRFRFPGSNLFLFILIGTRMIPPISLAIPFYLMGNWLGLQNTWTILIICYTFLNLPFAIWIMKKFFDSIPRSLFDSAMVDGCTRMGTLFRIALPLSLPGLGAAGILSFLWSWSEFLFALCFTSTPDAQTVTVGSYDFIADAFIAYNWLAAAGVLVALPVIIFVFFFQKFIITGLSAGAVKG